MSANEQRSELSLDAEYQQIHENIRTTDDISFKRMGLVPLISGGVISLLAKSGIPWGVMCFASLFAAIVVFGIFRWELRNIQSCNWQRARAEDMGDTRFPDAPELRFIPQALIQIVRFLANKRKTKIPETKCNAGPESEKAKPVRIGKTQAEIIIYLVVILAWLLLPGVDGLWRLKAMPGGWVGAVVSLVLGVGVAAWIVLSCPPSESLKPKISRPVRSADDAR